MQETTIIRDSLANTKEDYTLNLNDFRAMMVDTKSKTFAELGQADIRLEIGESKKVAQMLQAATLSSGK